MWSFDDLIRASKCDHLIIWYWLVSVIIWSFDNGYIPVWNEYWILIMVVHRLYLTKLSNTRPRKVVWCWLLYGVDLCLSYGPRFGIWILFCVSKCQNVKGQWNVNFQLLQITIISICYWKMPRYCSLYFFLQSFAWNLKIGVSLLSTLS